jgi:8-oxo-dGTP pyrophosphatase MutT (NUDIX family)
MPAPLTTKTPIRHAARALLLHDNKLLLMHVCLPDRSFWCTIGGGMDPGETVEEAIRRETFEETGFTDNDVTWVKPVWWGEHAHKHHGIDTMHRTTFVLGYALHTTVNPAALTASEKSHVKEFRWWPVEEIATAVELIFPASMIEHIKPLLRGEIPPSPLQIDLSDYPKNSTTA